MILNPVSISFGCRSNSIHYNDVHKSHENLMEKFQAITEYLKYTVMDISFQNINI